MTRYETLEIFPLVMVFLVSAPVFLCYSWKKAVLHGVLFFGMVLLTLFLLHSLMGTWSYFHKSYWNYYQQRLQLLKQIWNC